MKHVVDLSRKQPIHATYIRTRPDCPKFSPLNFTSVLSFDLSKTINESIPNQTPKQTKYSQEKFVSNSNMQTTRVVDLSCKQSATGIYIYIYVYNTQCFHAFACMWTVNTNYKNIFPPDIFKAPFQRVCQTFLRGFQSVPTFPSVSKGFQRVSKHFERVSKHFKRVSKGFQSVSKGFPKGFRSVSKRFQKRFQRFSNPQKPGFKRVSE